MQSRPNLICGMGIFKEYQMWRMTGHLLDIGHQMLFSFVIDFLCVRKLMLSFFLYPFFLVIYVPSSPTETLSWVLTKAFSGFAIHILCIFTYSGTCVEYVLTYS